MQTLIYKIQRQPSRKHFIDYTLYIFLIYLFIFFFNSLLSSIIIIVPKNVYILLSLLLSVYEQMRVSIFFFFLLKFLRFFLSLKRVCKYIVNHDI